jgi:hypothetical protein
MGHIRVDADGRLLACFSDPAIEPVDLGRKFADAIGEVEKCLEDRVIDRSAARSTQGSFSE